MQVIINHFVIPPELLYLCRWLIVVLVLYLFEYIKWVSEPISSSQLRVLVLRRRETYLVSLPMRENLPETPPATSMLWEIPLLRKNWRFSLMVQYLASCHPRPDVVLQENGSGASFEKVARNL